LELHFVQSLKHSPTFIFFGGNLKTDSPEKVVSNRGRATNPIFLNLRTSILHSAHSPRLFFNPTNLGSRTPTGKFQNSVRPLLGLHTGDVFFWRTHPSEHLRLPFSFRRQHRSKDSPSTCSRNDVFPGPCRTHTQVPGPQASVHTAVFHSSPFGGGYIFNTETLQVCWVPNLPLPRGGAYTYVRHIVPPLVLGRTSQPLRRCLRTTIY